MREDMAKVLVERERHNSKFGYHEGRARANRYRVEDDGEGLDSDSPRRGKMKPRVVCSVAKHLNENLSPLWNFLRKSCGRPWDKVYSEIREHLASTNAVQMHIVQHLQQYVKTDSTPKQYEHHEFFVDPHGILRQRSRKKERAAQAERTEIMLSSTCWLAMVGGIWYAFDGYTLDDTTTKGKLADVVFGDVQVSVFQWTKGRHVQVYPAVRWLRHNFIATSRRQLGKKELRARGLRNST